MVRIAIAVFSSHYETAASRASELTVTTLAAVSRLWWKSVNRWTVSTPGRLLRQKARREVDSQFQVFNCSHSLSFYRIIFAVFFRRGGAKLGPPIKQGETRAEKLRGQNLGPNTDQKPGWLLGAGGVAPSRCDGPGYDPRKIFENSYAKSCILVTTCCKISCFF